MINGCFAALFVSAQRMRYTSRFQPFSTQPNTAIYKQRLCWVYAMCGCKGRLTCQQERQRENKFAKLYLF